RRNLERDRVPSVRKARYERHRVRARLVTEEEDLLAVLAAERRLPEQEDKHVRDDDEERHPREASGRIAVPEREHRRTLLRRAGPPGRRRADGILSPRPAGQGGVVRRPLDQELVRRGLARDRTTATAVIASGRG